MKSNSTSARFLCLTGVMAALVCIMTMVIQIPIPLGYAHLGDAFILLTVLFVGKRSGFWAGGIGSALADLLTGYAYWAIPTFIIKSLMALLAGKIAYGKDETCTLFSVRTGIACVLSMVWMVAGYTVAGMFLYGSVAAGLSSAPGLAVKAVLNLVVCYGVGALFEKAKIRPLLTADRKGNV
ncbi:MAG: ECF transporter S component [Eubacteriales bacterium]|nr:ECF transporter S component [Eubacteriales bacterium]